MMIRSLILLASLLVAPQGCTRRTEPPPNQNAPKTVAAYHFVGAARVATSPDGLKLREIAAFNESRAWWQHAVERVVQAPGQLSGGRLPATAVQAAAPWLRPLVADLWQRESALQVQRGGAAPWDWTLAVELGPERMGVWRTNLMALAQVWNLGTVLQGTAGDLPTMEIAGTNTSLRIRWVEAGAWGLLGIGSPALPGLVEVLDRMRDSQRPVAPLTNVWLTVSADVAQLTGPLGLPPGADWPELELDWRGDGEHVRVGGRVRFPREVTGQLEVWQVPTNLVSEPLISFSAIRGVRPILQRVDRLRPLQLDPLPNQLFAWAQATAEGQLYCAFPMPGLAGLLPQLASTAPQIFPAWARDLKLTQFEYTAGDESLRWRGILPVVTPNLKSVRHLDQEFALGGLFPPIPLGPPPNELLAQLARDNLVYYSWEVTPPRIAQWIALSQLLSVMTQTPQLASGQPALAWLFRAAPELGNTATEILAVSPREWRFHRKSTVGFTAAELLLGARWLDSVSFPRPSLLLDRPGTAGRPVTSPRP